MKLSDLKKYALTAEGVLVWVTNVVLAIAAVLPHGLNWTHAGAYIAFITAVHTFATRFSAVQKVQGEAGLGTATAFNPVDPAILASLAAGVVGASAAAPVKEQPTAAPAEADLPTPEQVKAPEPVVEAAPAPEFQEVPPNPVNEPVAAPAAP